MNFLSPYLGMLKAAAIIALIVGLFGFGYRTGSGSTQAKWDAAELTRASAEKAAVLERVAQNQETFRKQEHNSERIANVHKSEINRVRADIARAPGLRIGPEFCGRPTAAAEDQSAAGGNGADTGSRVLSAEMDRAVKSLIEETERAAAIGRTAQEFIRSNGMAP
jgi:hypothetical protein